MLLPVPLLGERVPHCGRLGVGFLQVPLMDGLGVGYFFRVPSLEGLGVGSFMKKDATFDQ